MPRVWVLLLVIVALSAAPVGAQTVDQLRRAELQARGAVEQALLAYRQAEANSDARAGQLRQQWIDAEAAYRRAVAARAIVAATDQEAPADLSQIAEAAQQRQVQMRQMIAEHLQQRLASASGSEREQAYAAMEATLRTARLEAEVLAEAARRKQPTTQANAADGRGRRIVNATTQRMDDLLHRIATTDTTEQANGRGEVEHQVEMWLREREREMNLEEYQRLARHGQIISERTGRPVTGPQRERLARDAEEQLANMVAIHARDKKWLDLWSNKDSRAELARQLESRVASATEYKALDYLSPGEETMPQYYRALANAVRRQQGEVDQWYTGTYLGQTEEDGRRSALGARVNAWWNTGFGTLARASDLTGETSDAHVTARLNAMRSETDAAAEALMAAASTSDPARLPRHQRDLLTAYGYIQKGPDNRLSYTIPSASNKLSGLTQADLPGASVLDALSVETLAVTAASVAVPELAAARAAAWAGRAGYSARAADLLTKSAGVASSVGVDVASQYATTGSVDLTRTALDNLLLGPATGKLADFAGDVVTTGAGRVLRDTRLAKAFRESGNGRALMHEAEAMVRAATGITSEAALQTYIDSVIAGNPGLSREDVLANMTTGAMAKFMGGHRRNTSGDTSFWGKDHTTFDNVVANHAPPQLRELLAARGPLAVEERARVEAMEQTRREAWQRFDRIIPEGAAIDLARVNEAVLKGEFSWSDLKTIAADAPEFRLIHENVAQKREEFYDNVEKRARAMARNELDREHSERVRDLRQSGLSDSEMAARQAELQRWYDNERQLIDADAVRLGSKAASSDIDRSWKSDRVRRAAKDVQQELLYRRDLDRPGPTSARAYDLNEYYDVMPFVKDTFAKKIDLSREQGVEVDGVALSHGETMTATGLAAAMLHMDPAQRDRFMKNRLESASPDQRSTLEAQFAWARRSLDEQVAVLDQRARQVAEATGRDPDDIDVRVTARDQIYGERTRALQAMERQIQELPDQDGPEARRLRAQWERDMSVALREGIETYSQSAGLDLIINTLQAEGKKPGPLLADNDFTIQGRLKGKYTPEQLDAMVNDQSMFLVEHLNGYRHGHESAETAARAIGKYGERALLGLHAKGDLLNLPDDHPLSKFKKIAQDLVERKDNPQAMREYLKTLDPSGDPDKGLRALMGYVEELPGLKGISEPVLPDGPAAAEHRHAINLAREAARRRWQQQRDEARLFGGPEAEMALIEKEQADAAAEFAELKKASDEQTRLDGQYLRKDQPRAQRLESEIAALEERLHNLPGGAVAGMGLGDELRKEIDDRKKQLKALGDQYVAAGSPDQMDEADRTRERRLESLAGRQQELVKDAVAVQDAVRAAETQRELARQAEIVSPDAPLGDVADRRPTDLPTTLGDDPPMTALRPEPDGLGWGGPQTASGAGLQLRIGQSRYRVGQTIDVAYRTPDDPEWPMPRLVLRDSAGEQQAAVNLPRRGEGTVTLRAPVDVQTGARLVAERDGDALCALPLDVVVTPVPGAIRLAGGQTYSYGATTTVTIQAPEDYYHKSPWLGLFRLDGAQATDQRVTLWNLRSLNESVDITLPNTGGEFELRLYDRDQRFFVLDATRLRVVARPAPGSLRLAASDFTYGQPIEVVVNVPDDIYLHAGNAWIGLYDVNQPWVGDTTPRLAHQWVQRRQQSLTFTAPTTPGDYELRLFDRNGSPLLLDIVPFTVTPRPAPGALTLDSDRYRIGQPVSVKVSIPEEVYIHPGNAHVSLFAVPPSDDLGGPQPRRSSLQHQWLHDRQAEMTFQPPPDPGVYEVRLYDRNGDHTTLARQRFTVAFQAPPEGTLTPSAEVVYVGQPFTVQLNVPEDIYVHQWGKISLHPLDNTVGSPSSSPAIASLWFSNVGRQGVANFTAPDTPGNYEIRLTDREVGMLLAKAPVRVEVPKADGALQLSKKQFQPGEEFDISVALPEGAQLFSWAKVVLTDVSRPGFDPRPDDQSYRSRVYIDRETMTARMTAPDWPGLYEIRLLDRDATFNRLDRVQIEVVQPNVPGALTAPGSAVQDQVITISYNFPDGIHRERWAHVALVDPRRTMAGGAWNDQRVVRRVDLPAERSGSVEMTMPDYSGTFELWLVDRPGAGLIIDRRSIVVSRPAQ